MRKRRGLRLPTDPTIFLNQEIYPETAYIRIDLGKNRDILFGRGTGKPMAPAQTPEIQKGIPEFKLEIPELGNQGSPITTLLSYDGKTGRLYLGDRLVRLVTFS